MAVDKIKPDDARVKHQTANLNGRNYHYLLALPEGEIKGTALLVHGWPDISFGWRYQIPMFLDMGFRVIAIDLMGFGRTDAPKPEPVSVYGYKRAADDIKELTNQLGISHIDVLGGHDWGGVVVWRVVLWYPELISRVFSVCTPYFAPSKNPFTPLEEVVKEALPTFRYQLQLRSGIVGEKIKTEKDLRQFLNGMYGGKGPNGEIVFTVEKGVLFENLPLIGLSPLFDPEEMDYYVKEYARNGMGGNCNWYATTESNYKDERNLKSSDINIPALFIAATRDSALPPAMSANMEKHIPKLTRHEVNTSHWALWEAPEEVNAQIKNWLEPLLQTNPVKSSL